jgi:hypothetical protein
MTPATGHRSPAHSWGAATTTTHRHAAGADMHSLNDLDQDKLKLARQCAATLIAFKGDLAARPFTPDAA